MLHGKERQQKDAFYHSPAGETHNSRRKVAIALGLMSADDTTWGFPSTLCSAQTRCHVNLGDETCGSHCDTCLFYSTACLSAVAVASNEEISPTAIWRTPDFGMILPRSDVLCCRRTASIPRLPPQSAAPPPSPPTSSSWDAGRAGSGALQVNTQDSQGQSAVRSHNHIFCIRNCPLIS